MEVVSVTLDLLDVDSAAIDVFKHKPHDIKIHSYTAKDGFAIDRVVEGDFVVLDSVPEGAFVKVARSLSKLLSFLHTYVVEANGKATATHFVKEEGEEEWKAVEEEEFYNRFNALSFTKYDYVEKEFNIAKKVKESEFYVNKSSKFPFAVYAANSTCRVKKVVDKKATIWESKDGELCTKASFYPSSGKPRLLWLVIRDSDLDEAVLYFSKVKNVWASVDKTTYLQDLKEAGFDSSGFDDKVVLDISKPDKDLFYTTKDNVDIVTMNRYCVRPGFRINKVVSGNELIWEASGDEFCIYFRFGAIENGVSIGALFITSSKNENKILYYKKNLDSEWVIVGKNEYYACLVNRNDKMYTHKGDGKIVMSSFRNKQGIKIVTYASKVENSRGNIILVHGLRGHFTADYCTFNMDWIYEHYGFDIFPHLSIFDEPVDAKKASNAERYKSYFEYKTLEGMNLFNVLCRSQYEGTFVEALNNLGFSVYGLDLQSHGFSESAFGYRCHVEDFKDYVHDVLQFVSIVKRGKFSDSSEKWDEDLIYGEAKVDARTFLLGFSSGGNIVMQAVQEFYKKVGDTKAKFVDGLLGLSPMLSLDIHLDTFFKKVGRRLLWLIAYFSPKSVSPGQSIFDCGIAFETFADYKTDMLYYNKKHIFKTLASVFDACDNVIRDENMKYYPKYLPTFLAHTKDDDQCGVKGPRDMIDKRFKGKRTATFVEFTGSGHHLAETHYIPVVIPYLSKWFNDNIKLEIANEASREVELEVSKNSFVIEGSLEL
ncbi:hypothetical protein BEWA_001610 [Theileria equi strain WA]|uniref:Serine aminopeptidase S33 domain-containing protein n=1 Tax=Theileria equi strain WA TaxID=1537102 RepID=L0B0T9_THEEQ|nr:hypothetical protein BEWA_001610 [Theileria equi strain WA]AFZ80754.1 hypothetical protein BEWA_001610 [Theileria equi strain WA]|eukprot:XP_004830420.1 hypothetical protein BEWA_001610 [Theileria equi strain WA]